MRTPPQSRPALAAGLPLLALAGIVLDCGGGRPAMPDRAATVRVRAADVAPRASAAASAAPADDAPPAAEVPESTPPPRLGAPGSTKRTIACGERRCKAGAEACVFREAPAPGAWACVDANGDEAEGGSLACDDASDCGPGLVCCNSFASASSYFVCTRRSGPDSDCRYESCVEGDGAACPRGQTCRHEACVPKSSARASCGDAGRCPADKPFCRWDAAGRSCLTASEAEATMRDRAYADDEVSLYACTRPADCGQGAQCCTGMSDGPKLTLCGGNCDLANSIVVCEKRAECLRVCDRLGAGVRADCRKSVRCAEVGRGLKGCVDLT